MDSAAPVRGGAVNRLASELNNGLTNDLTNGPTGRLCPVGPNPF